MDGRGLMGNTITRNLQVYALTRQQSIEVGLVYNTRIKNSDGTFTASLSTVTTMVFFTSITPKQIQRLREGGVTIAKGAVLSLNEELVSAPIEVLSNKQDDYTFLTRAKVVDYSISEGVTVLILDTETLKYAN